MGNKVSIPVAVAIAAVVGAMMVVGGFLLPHYSDVSLAVIYFPFLPGALAAMTLVFALFSRRLALLAAALFASPSLMMIGDDTVTAILLYAAIFLLGGLGILAAVGLQMLRELVRPAGERSGGRHKPVEKADH
jgi:hypothetical protein